MVSKPHLPYMHIHACTHTHTNTHQTTHTCSHHTHTHTQIQHTFLPNHTLTHQTTHTCSHHTHTIKYSIPLCLITHSHTRHIPSTHIHTDTFIHYTQSQIFTQAHRTHTTCILEHTQAERKYAHTHTHSLNTFKKKVFEHPTRHWSHSRKQNRPISFPWGTYIKRNYHTKWS